MTAPRVLVVDDYDDTRETLRTVLEDAGFAVAEAANVPDTISYLDATTEPHVVLLDFLLGRDNATPVLAHIAETPGLATRCAVISLPATPSRLTPEYKALAERLGVPLVAKPFDIDALVAVVAKQAASLAGS